MRIDPDDKAGEVAILLDSSVDAAAPNSPIVADRDAGIRVSALLRFAASVGAAAVRKTIRVCLPP